jgi:hypothetical protein
MPPPTQPQVRPLLDSVPVLLEDEVQFEDGEGCVGFRLHFGRGASGGDASARPKAQQVVGRPLIRTPPHSCAGQAVLWHSVCSTNVAGLLPMAGQPCIVGLATTTARACLHCTALYCIVRVQLTHSHRPSVRGLPQKTNPVRDRLHNMLRRNQVELGDRRRKRREGPKSK